MEGRVDGWPNEYTPPKHPRRDFALYCLRRWTVGLVDDTCRWLWKVIH